MSGSLKSSQRNYGKILLDYFVLTIGCLIYCAAWTQIFEPNQIISGGVTGLCAIIQYGTGFPIAISYAAFNVVLLVLAFLLLGKSFGVKTIYALAVITLFLEVLPVFNLPELRLKEHILNPVIASFIEAFGISLILEHGGSSGGTDIIALIINKYWPISIGRVYIVLDFVVLMSSTVIAGMGIDDVVYGYLAVICFSLSLDYLVLGKKSSVQLLIFSERYEELADFINRELQRGVTALSGEGWYSHTEKKVLMIVIRRTEMSELTKKVKELDPKAFVAVMPLVSVYGEGFEEIKVIPSFALKGKKSNRKN